MRDSPSWSDSESQKIGYSEDEIPIGAFDMNGINGCIWIFFFH